LPAATRRFRRQETCETEKTNVAKTLECPHCGIRMKKWLVPASPFTQWDTEFMYICFNDSCPYLARGWDIMNKQGNRGISYRQMFNPENGSLCPVPVPSLQALRESIVEETG